MCCFNGYFLACAAHGIDPSRWNCCARLLCRHNRCRYESCLDRKSTRLNLHLTLCSQQHHNTTLSFPLYNAVCLHVQVHRYQHSWCGRRLIVLMSAAEPASLTWLQQTALTEVLAMFCPLTARQDCFSLTRRSHLSMHGHDCSRTQLVASQSSCGSMSLQTGLCSMPQTAGQTR